MHGRRSDLPFQARKRGICDGGLRLSASAIVCPSDRNGANSDVTASSRKWPAPGAQHARFSAPKFSLLYRSIEVRGRVRANFHGRFLGERPEAIDGARVVMCHYPLPSRHRTIGRAYMLHGRSHNTIPFDTYCGQRLDVGVDAQSYTPVSWKEIQKNLDAVAAMDARGYRNGQPAQSEEKS